MAPVIIVLGLFPLHPPLCLHLSPQQWPHVIPQHTWKAPGEPLQRPTSSTHTGKGALFLSILALGSLLPSFFTSSWWKSQRSLSCYRQLLSWVDGWRWGRKVRGGGKSGGLRDLMPMLSSRWPCCFLSQTCGSLAGLLSRRWTHSRRSFYFSIRKAYLHAFHS